MTAPGARAGCAVAIDLGTSNTVAILRWADGRTRPLLFDGRPVLPSAVFVAADGAIHAGRDAERMAQLDPASYDPNPKRRIDEGAVLLGGREVPVAELLAAILRAVARAATEAVGFLPALVLTYPAAWGTPRRQTLAEAAARAGWPPPRLVPEPVAAARYFTEVMRRPVPPGGTIAVFDFGGGTLDVALVRRDGASFTVTGWGGAEDLGGLDVDAALVAHLGQQLERDQPAVWRQLSQPVEEIDRRHRRQFWEDVRAAKEMLSRTSLAPVAVPGVNTSLHVTREELEELARPLVRRAVAELVTTVQRSRLKVEDLSAVFLVGGASRIPLVAQLLHTELGIAPTVLEQPELPVAEGALADLVGALAPPTRPAPRQPARPAPVSTGAMTGMPTSGMPVSSLPVSGSPAARMPVSATPVSPYPAPPQRVPMPPPPFMPAPKRRRTGMHPVLVVFIVLAVVGAATAALVVFVVSQSGPASKATFQAMAEVQTVKVGLTAPDAFVRSFLTESRGVTIGQVDRHVSVSVVDLATKAVRNTVIGDAAGYDGAIMAGDMAVVLARPEGSKRKIYGVSAVDLHTWTVTVGADGVLLPGDNAPQANNAQIVLWLDRASGRMTHVNSVTGKQFGNTDGLPANWQLIYPGTGPAKVVLVLAGGAVYQIGGDKPSKLRTDPVGNGAVVGRTELDDVVVAGGQTSYQVSVYGSSGRTGGFSLPTNRAPVWIDACRGLELCVVDEVGKDPTTREIGVYATSGNRYYRMPVPYADTTRPPEFLGPNGDGDVIVSTKKGDVDGAVVFSPTFKEIGEYEGRVVGFDRTRAIQVAGSTAAGPVQVTLTGLDLTPKVSTKLGTPTIRRVGCSWNLTSLLCPTEKDFTLWRITK